eukprot:COSAG02_NODE_5507_length_4272_cov_2.252755_2_plen_362_part_00
MYSPRMAIAAEDALQSTLEVIAALKAELGVVASSPSSPGEVAPNASIDNTRIPAPVGHRSPWHVAPAAEMDSAAIPKPSRGVAQYCPTDDTDEDAAWSDDDVPRSPGEVGALRADTSFRGFDDVPIPGPRPITETDIDEMLLAEYERELEEQGPVVDEGTLMRTESGTLISEAHDLIEQSQQALMRLAEDGLREELEMADADLEAWESLGTYADGFSPRPGWNKLEQAEEFLAEGDVFLEEQRRGMADSDDSSSDDYEPSPALAPEERDAYLQWQRQNNEFEQDATQFLDSDADAQQAFADIAEGLRNPSFGVCRPTRLNGPVPLGQRARPSAESRPAVEATALAAVQSEIAALRAELGIA